MNLNKSLCAEPTKLRTALKIILSVAISYLISFGVVSYPALSRIATSDLRDSVALIYDSESAEQPYATGFLTGFHSSESDKPKTFAFLITNKYVVSGQKSLWVRFRQNNSAKLLCLDSSNVTLSERPEVDLIAIPVPDISEAGPPIIEPSCFLDHNRMNDIQVSEGADVYTIGWTFSRRPGSIAPGLAENNPASELILRFGKISFLNNKYWYNVRDPKMLEQAYVADIPTTLNGGICGSPVLMYQHQVPSDSTIPSHAQPMLIGIIKGASSAYSPVFNLDSLNKKKTVRNNGMTEYAETANGLVFVEPAPNLCELMETIKRGLVKSGHKIR